MEFIKQHFVGGLVLTLPGSVIFLILGFIVAFSGKSGEPYVLVCLLLSIVNAHFMGMVYLHLFIGKRGNRKEMEDRP